jgi:hypothetical protein
MSIERHAAMLARGVHVRVFVGADDVTDRCFGADDTPGQQIAMLFKLNAEGRKYTVDGDVATETIQGPMVRMERRETA